MIKYYIQKVRGHLSWDIIIFVSKRLFFPLFKTRTQKQKGSPLLWPYFTLVRYWIGNTELRHLHWKCADCIDSLWCWVRVRLKMCVRHQCFRIFSSCSIIVKFIGQMWTHRRMWLVYVFKTQVRWFCWYWTFGLLSRLFKIGTNWKGSTPIYLCQIGCQAPFSAQNWAMYSLWEL